MCSAQGLWLHPQPSESDRSVGHNESASPPSPWSEVARRRSRQELALRDLKGNEHEADQERTPPGPGDWETPAVRLGGLTID